MDIIGIFFGVAGGLALFLFGLKILSDGLKKAAGERLKIMLERLTNRASKGVLVGAFTTALIQSSSITMVTLIGLINAGLLTFKQAIGVMLGAEIGTTITAQIIAFRIGIYYLPIIAVGFFMYFFTKDKKYHYIGQTILGFGILFLGMSIMSGSVKTLRIDPFFIEFLKSFGRMPILGVIAGAIFTGIIQSSSATTGLVIAMGMENVITLESAIALIFGANIGTCVTGLIASIGSSLQARRVAVAQVMVNVLGVALFLPLIFNFANIVAMTSNDLPRQIANAHTIFNVIVTIVMLPLVGILAKIVERVVPGEEIKIERGTKYIDKRILNTPIIAISQAHKEVNRMASIAANMLEMVKSAILNKDKSIIKKVYEQEDVVDELRDKIEDYLNEISKKSLSIENANMLACLNHVVTDIERVADHAENMAEFAEEMIKNKLHFSRLAIKEFENIHGKTLRVYKKSIKALENRNKRIAKEVIKLEDEIDRLEKKYRNNHIKRLEKGICDPRAGIIFVEILTNLERVSDHACNIAGDVLMKM